MNLTLGHLRQLPKPTANALTKLWRLQMRLQAFGSFDTEADSALQGYLAKAVSGLSNPYGTVAEAVTHLGPEMAMFDDAPEGKEAVRKLAKEAFATYSSLQGLPPAQQKVVASVLDRVRWSEAGAN